MRKLLHIYDKYRTFATQKKNQNKKTDKMKKESLIQYLRLKLSLLLRLGDDAAPEEEIIEGIKSGVEFRGAKLWILVLAVFVASLGLNTNSAAVIIGAMLISPLMGPIIGMGLGAGIYDFELLKRSWRSYITATLFSVATATVYFYITPLADAQSELLARTSPTIYDVLIALCGGLAGIIALSSRSQRTGNVIPGVAIATALMPPLCTVGFGVATANWIYAAGALFLFVINTIFIAFATLIAARFIMRLHIKTFVDTTRERRVKRIIVSLVLLTVIPAAILTFGMVRQNYFEKRVNRFIAQELHFERTQVVSYRADYDNRSFKVVLIGEEVDSVSLKALNQRLPEYKLDGVDMQVIQGANSLDYEQLSNRILSDNKKEGQNDKLIITQQNNQIVKLENELHNFTQMTELSAIILPELQILYPQVRSLGMAMGSYAERDTTQQQPTAIVGIGDKMKKEDRQRLTQWLCKRAGMTDIHIIFEQE